MGQPLCRYYTKLGELKAGHLSDIIEVGFEPTTRWLR